MLVWGFAPDGKRWERSFDFTREEYHTNGGIMKCEYCHREYIQRRYDQRFCCIGCKTEWWVEERRNAIAAYRERALFLGHRYNLRMMKVMKATKSERWGNER